MDLNYNKINISVNSQNILCENASFSSSAEQKPIYIINNKTIFDYVPTQLKSSLNITYFLEINSGEPNYSIITGFKSSNGTGNTQVTINIANNIITGYLSKFSFICAPMQSIKAQATYEIFNPITGLFLSSNVIDGNLYNITNASGLSNYFSTYLYSGMNRILNSNILQFEYGFSANISPIYCLSNPYPIQIYISEAAETLNTISELQNNSQYSGNNLYNIFGIDTIKLYNVSNTWGDNELYLSFAISGMKQNSNKVDINTSNLILFNDQFQQAF